MTRATRLLVALLFAGFAAACASGASVGQLKTNPGRYVDKSVTVHGTVTSSWGIPLVPFKMYQVDDGTGEILVVADHDRIPSRGARVKVTGKGKLRREQTNRRHLLEYKSSTRTRRLDGTVDVSKADTKKVKKLLGL